MASILKSAGTAATVDRGGIDWVDVNNALDDDSDYAIASIGNQGTSDWLRLTNWGFSDTIMSGDTINGFYLAITHGGSRNLVLTASQVYLLDSGGNPVGTYKTSSAWPSGATIEYFGGASDMWGTSLTAADVRSSNFGVQMYATNGSKLSSSAYVYYMSLTVYYTPAPSGWTGTIMEVTNPSAIMEISKSSITKVMEI